MDVFSEVVLFSMDRAVTRYAKDAPLHRLHDDFLDLGSPETNVSKPSMLWRNLPASWVLTSMKPSLGA